MEAKLDRLTERTGEIRADLQEHMRRTEIAESRIELLTEELRPLKSHVAMWAGAGKLFAALLSAGGLAVAVLKLVH